MVGIYDLLAASAAAIIAVATLLLVQRRVRLSSGGRRGEFVRYFSLAALSALVCAVMNVLEVLTQGGIVAAAVGNATNVFAPAMVWAGARRLNGRNVIGTATAGASALLVLAVTFVVSLDDATLIKTAGIAVFSLLAAYELRRSALRTTAGAIVVAYALGAFAAFNLGRIVVALTAGTDSWVWNSLASARATSVASAVVILIMSVAAVALGRALRVDPVPGSREYELTSLRTDAGAMLADRGPLVGLTLRLPELDLIRTAHGSPRADDVVATLRAAARDVFPDEAVGTLSRDTVAAIAPASIERAGLDYEVHARFAARMRDAGYDDVPDLRILHRGIADEAQLDEFIGAPARLRPRLPGRRQISR